MAVKHTHRLKTALEAQAHLQSTTHPSSSSSSSSSQPAPEPFTSTSSTKDPDSSSTASPPPPIFGSRLYRQGVDDPNSFNAWDHVEPPPEYLATIRSLLNAQAETRITATDAETLYHCGERPAEYWNQFYSHHQHKFFKDRKWLGSEFPELIECIDENAGDKRILEVGCGAGNTVFPLMERNRNPLLQLYACDYSSEAVEVVKANPTYKDPPMGKCQAFVWDLSSKEGPPPELRRSDDNSLGQTRANGHGDEDAQVTATVENVKESEGLDIVCLIFCLSALHPREWAQAALNIKTMLKPGGLILLRDYARYDLPQLRFRKGRMLDDNFYVRGDGTRVYFFTPEELQDIFNTGSPPTPIAAVDWHSEVQASTIDLTTSSSIAEDTTSSLPKATTDEQHAKVAAEDHCPPRDFDTLQMILDRRMLVNRKEDKKMYRSWIQSKLRKR